MPTTQLETATTGTDQVPLLQATLVELIDLSLQGKQLHWNVVGSDFKSVHEFLDELIDEYREWYDTVAERLVAIGATADGRVATVAATTTLKGLPEGTVTDRDAIAALAERVAIVAASIGARADLVGEGDLVSQGILIEILGGLEKQRWMLRAHLA